MGARWKASEARIIAKSTNTQRLEARILQMLMNCQLNVYKLTYINGNNHEVLEMERATRLERATLSLGS